MKKEDDKEETATTQLTESVPKCFFLRIMPIDPCHRPVCKTLVLTYDRVTNWVVS